ncbi:MAG TPA: STAS domain-containing protein [Sporichthyaceae bacterium]|nr:STAS domain-containing protein [Sporichthyaceae bacterium]
MSEPSAAAPQRLRVRRDPDGAVVLHGEIDLGTAPALWAALDARSPAGVVQVVDLRGVTYLDSAGLSVLYEHAARLHLLVAPASVVATVIDVSGLMDATSVELRAPDS